MSDEKQELYNKFLTEYEEFRQKCNKLTNEERERLSEEFWRIFYDENYNSGL